MGEKLIKALPAALAALVALTGCGGGDSTAQPSPTATASASTKVVNDRNQTCNFLFQKDDDSRLITASTLAANLTGTPEKSQRTKAKISAGDLEHVANTANEMMTPLVLALARPLRDFGESDQAPFDRDAYAAAEKAVLDECSTQHTSYQGNKAAKERGAQAARDAAAKKAADEAAAAAPKEYSGVGDDVMNITKHGTGAEVAIIQHTGGSNFAVHTLDSALANTDLLVNEVGPYSGTVVFDIRSSRGQTAALKVTAGGAWTIKLVPLTSVRKLDGSVPMTGRGDDVFYYTGPAKAAVFTHDGSSNIAVHSYGTRADLLVNEVGPYNGTVVWTPGLYQITADGNWSATIK